MSSSNTVYISYRPEQSLHIAQPLFNGLRSADFDVFMNIEQGVDDVNLNQIAARAHFIILLTPGAVVKEDPHDRLAREFTHAVEHKRNIVLLLTRDMHLEDELSDTAGMLAHLPRVPQMRIQPKQIKQVIRVLQENHLTKDPVGEIIPTPEDEVDKVAERIEQAREYTMQATIRLNTERMFFKAVVKIRQGDYDGALTDLDAVIADNPQNESAYLQRGRVLRKKGQTKAALKDYEQAARLSPKLVAAHIGRGELLLALERFQPALDAFQHALNMEGESAPAIAGMALTQAALSQHEDANRLWGWLVERDSHYSDPVWTGEVFDWDEALVQRAKVLLNSR
jgi:tetratricopeptide (TPR) repeat protein